MNNVLNKKQKIVFMGTPYFADIILRQLLSDGYDVTTIITAQDKPVGRGGNLSESEASKTATLYGVTLLKPKNKAELSELLATIKYDLLIVAAFGMIIPEPILQKATIGAYNLHASILPKYRGASPISAAILNNERETGVTLMEISAKMDEGNIVSIARVPILDDDTTKTLTLKLANVGAKLLTETLPKIIAGEIKSIPQETSAATYCSLLKKEDGYINPEDSASDIERQIRAYQPWPSAFIVVAGKRVKLLKATVTDNGTTYPRENALHILDGKLYLRCNSSSLEILELQPEGKKPMTAKEYLNGNPNLTI